MRVVKLDACSAIYAARCSLIDILNQVYDQVMMTKAVYREAVERGKVDNHADAYVLEQAIQDGRISVLEIQPPDREAIRRMPLLGKLGKGEGETIYEALREGCVAILDDRDSRTAASTLKVPHQSSVSLLVEALLGGRLTASEFDRYLERLAAAAGIPADRVHEARRIARMSRGGSDA